MLIPKSDQAVNPDYAQAWQYVEAVTGENPSTAIVDFRVLSELDKSAPAAKLRGTLPQYWHTLCTYNAIGYGVFVNVNVMNGHGNTLEHIHAIRVHAVDLDNLSSQINLEAATRWSPAPCFATLTSIVEGRSKHHVYWRVLPYSGNDYATHINRQLRHKFDGDKAVVDPSRVLRVAGFVHRKDPSAPHLVTMTRLPGWGQVYPVQALAEALRDVVVIEGGGGARHPLGEPSLAAPSLALVERALSLIDPNDLGRDDWLSTLAAARQAAWTHAQPADVDALLMAWCARYNGDNPAEDAKQINSLRETSAGWGALLKRAPSLQAELMFGQPPATPAVPDAPYWSTFNASDGAKTSAVVCMKCLTDAHLPVAHDEFADALNVTAKVPWHGDGVSYPHRWSDNDTHGCKAYLEMMFIRPSKETVFDSVSFIAQRNRYHPVRDYLIGLRWDGVARLSSFLHFYFGAPDTPFTRLIGSKYMISAVARIMRPGCKVDTMLILEGEQGLRKSSALRALAGDEWFTDQMPDLSSKDASMQLLGKWIIEFAELDRMNKAEVTAVKSYASRQVDTYRPPYGRATVNVLRQCVFAGSTNETEYLRDQTGNRRYWPVRCGRIDLDAIRRDRDQLWAEAVRLFDVGTPWWLEGADEALAGAEQDARRECDPWEVVVRRGLALFNNPVTIEQVCQQVLGLPFEKQNAALNKRVAQCLRRAGYERQQIRTGADRQWAYIKIA